MNLGHLYVNLGVKGADKAVKQVFQLRTGFTDLASDAFKAKAAIIGAIYAFQRMMSESNQTGTKLSNFNTLLGVGSAKALQQYQYAARQVGVANESVENSFKSLQEQMHRTLYFGEAPKGLARVAQLLGDVEPGDIKKWMDKPELLLQQLQRYAQIEKNPAMRNMVLKSFGLDDGMIAALAKNAFRPDVLNKAPVYNDKQFEQLHKNDVAWTNLGEKIKRAFGAFNIEHGRAIIKDITMMTDKVLTLSKSLLELEKSIGALKGLTQIFEGWGLIFDTINNALEKFQNLKSADDVIKLFDEGVDLGADAAGFALDEMAKSPHAGMSAGAKLLKFFLPSNETDTGPKETPLKKSAIETGPKRVGSLKPIWEKRKEQMATPSIPASGSAVAAPSQPAATGTTATTQNTEMNQTININGDVKDPEQVKRAASDGVKEAYRQYAAQGQGT